MSEDQAVAATTFDTLAASRALKSAGINEDHADAIVDVLSASLGAHVATKTDLAEFETRLTVRFGGMLAVAVGVIVAAIKLL